nr:hypothetical protein [Streptomyces malaysiensis]
MVSPAGDEWETLYRKYGRKMLHAATLAAGGSAHDGWDGVQHAFSQAWLRLTDPSKPPVGNWAGWLRKAAVRHVVETAKGEARTLPNAGHAARPGEPRPLSRGTGKRTAAGPALRHDREQHSTALPARYRGAGQH